MYKKRHDAGVLFLEDAFGSGVYPDRLRKAGYEVVCFRDAFPDVQRRIEQSVKDPRIIKYCHENKYVLVTTDKEMLYTHVETIRKTEILIIATANNRIPMDTWVNALITAKKKIDRLIKKSERPYFASLGSTGNLNRKSISAGTRRHRPKEGQEK